MLSRKAVPRNRFLVATSRRDALVVGVNCTSRHLCAQHSECRLVLLSGECERPNPKSVAAAWLSETRPGHRVRRDLDSREHTSALPVAALAIEDHRQAILAPPWVRRTEPMTSRRHHQIGTYTWNISGIIVVNPVRFGQGACGLDGLVKVITVDGDHHNRRRLLGISEFPAAQPEPDHA